MRTLVLIVPLLLLPFTALAATSEPAGCALADVDAAARALVHPDARVLRVDVLEGVESALVAAPVVYPYERARLVAAEGAWCVPAAGIARLGLDDLAAARAFAATAGARWMDDVTVEDAALAGDVALVSTHALTNGIDAAWTIVLGARGIEDARFVVTGFAVAPFVAETEGFTALLGQARDFAPDARGVLRAVALLAPPEATPTLPVVTVNPVDTMPDNFRINTVYGDSPGIGPSVGRIRTGEPHLDTLERTRDAARENYEDFLGWGLQKGWTSNVGKINVDDSTAAECLACVFISQSFNIHLFSEVVPALALLAGTSFPDDELAYKDVLGHEMFHNFQNAYYKPGAGRGFENAYIEATARTQEALHSYGWINHQPGSLVFANNANGANGYMGTDQTASVAHGPAGRTYAATMFWLPFVGEHGGAGLAATLPATFAAAPLTGYAEIKALVEGTTGAPIDDDLARLAVALLTGKGMVFGPTDGSDVARDWGAFTERWTPATLSGTRTVTLTDGGMAGWRVASGSTVRIDGAVHAYAITTAGAFATVQDGDTLTAPFLVVVGPAAGVTVATVSVS